MFFGKFDNHFAFYYICLMGKLVGIYLDFVVNN